jgi:P27 family predicted phage terminase small subunit
MGYENSGRRPQPTALKVLRGNPSKTKLNEHEPKPPQGEVKAPNGLTKAAKRVWRELAPICLAMGTLTPADVRPFATLCELQATLLTASAEKDTDGFRVLGPLGAHAAIRLERETAQAIRPYYALFGLEPISRARIHVPQKPDVPVSKWAGALS